MHKHWKPEEYDRQAESLKKALESLRKEEHQLEKKLKKRGTATRQRKMSTPGKTGG
jgi:prefoldin subunit 5